MIGGLLWLIFGGWQELKLPKHLAKPPSGVECAAVQDAKVHLEVTPVDISIPSIDATPLLEQNGEVVDDKEKVQEWLNTYLNAISSHESVFPSLDDQDLTTATIAD